MAKRSVKKEEPRKEPRFFEFMLTYGWMILVVLAAVGALAYFGVLNPPWLDSLQQEPEIVVYDCGAYLIKGTELTLGELTNASVLLKEEPVSWRGLFLKAYYDLEGCVETTDPLTNNNNTNSNLTIQ